MNPNSHLENLLREFSKKYIWWQSPDASLQFPERIVAQVMEIGDYRDVQTLIQAAGEDALKSVIKNAQSGWFSPRSWHFWHYRLDLCHVDRVPALPQRLIP
jgi:hypothetical protein